MSSVLRHRQPAIVHAARSRGWVPPTNGFWSLEPESFGLLAEPHTIAMDVTAQVPQKRAAIAAHHSQMGDNDPFSQMSNADAVRWLGVEYFRRANIESDDHRPLELLCTSTS